jgi:tRNA (adenine37-N6)-methyltransferase
MRTPFKDKFGIPRQPGLAESAWGIVELGDHPFYVQALKGLETFSHLWIIFEFHQHDAKAWKPTIRPPRLGGRERIGVLASRSPHRPNPIGLSCVKLDRIEGKSIYVSGVDILDGSPILDIKPYLPYADSFPNASSGWASAPIERIPLEWSENVEAVFLNNPSLRKIAEEIIGLDPRPAFQKRKYPVGKPESIGRKFGAQVLDFDVRWVIRETSFFIEEIIPFVSGKKTKNNPE